MIAYESVIAVFDVFTPFAIQTGVLCAVFQIVLYVLFASSNHFGNRGPWSTMPSFTAHQIVVIPVLTYLSVKGLREFDISDIIGTATTTALERVMSPRHGYFPEMVLGMMFFWDIPTGLCTPALRELPMLLHHFGMLLASAVSSGVLSNGIPLFGYYAPFFCGLAEISSLPLIVVNMFHPRHKAWHAYLTSTERPGWVRKLNDMSRPLFAFLFIVVRTIAFPYIAIMGMLRDIVHVLSLPLDQRNNVPNLPLYIFAFFCVSFSGLQLYWGSLVIQQLLKPLRVPTVNTSKRD